MFRPAWKAAVLLGTALLLAALASGVGLVLDRTWRSARLATEAGVARAAQAVEAALTRQLLQVDGALASLPALLAATAGPEEAPTPERAERLLQALNFQTTAFRDLLLLWPDGSAFATARPRGRGRPAPPMKELADGAAPGALALAGPVRAPATGEWAFFVGRPVVVEGIGRLLAAAEVPLPLLAKLLGDTGADAPGTRIALLRPDGRLLASLPHDEFGVGRPSPLAGRLRTDGAPFALPDAVAGRTALAAARTTLYGDVTTAALVDEAAAMTEWARDRDRVLAAAAAAAGLLVALAGAVGLALRQREKLEAERVRARVTLEGALEAMSDGFVMWDEEDRLVTCNSRYRELYAESAPFIRPGARFEEIIRAGMAAGQYPQAADDPERFVADVVAWHLKGDGVLERLLPDGRWLLVTERRTATGGAVGIRTDITPLKAALAELADANARAQSAVAEAEAQNAALLDRESRIRFLAHHDGLTGLPNRVLFRREVDEALTRRGTAGEGLALLYLDLDRFKEVNDTLGHVAGDALLEAVAGRLRGCVAADDVVARFGGDEFAIASLAPDPDVTALLIGERVIATLAAPFPLAGRSVSIGASVGVAVAGPGEGCADDLIKKADIALYAAKDAGRGVLRVFEPAMEAKLQARIGLGADLRHALERGELELAYQPVMDLGTDRLTGFEALLRWRHPVRGPVSPAEFIPIAEENGLIDALGAWALDRACSDMAPLPDRLRVAVNLSPRQLRSDALVTAVATALGRSGLRSGRLELEITESALLGDDAHTRAILHRLRDLGASIVLDDFGTGYSSLSHLRAFPFQKIKVDQSFIREMTTRADCAAIVRSVVSLADQLGMTTTAEGVETRELLDFVRAAGCSEAQGYLFGRPAPLLDAARLAMADAAAGRDGRRRRSARLAKDVA